MCLTIQNKRARCVETDDAIYVIPYGDFVPKAIIETDEFGVSIIESYSKNSIDDLRRQLSSEHSIDEDIVANDISEFLNDIFYSENNESIEVSEAGSYFDTYKAIQSFHCKAKKPMKVFLELTYCCNLRCPHCYVQEDLTVAKDFPPYDKVINLIDQLSGSGVIELNITGGEPSLHPNYLDIMRHASKSMLVTLLTNGISLAKSSKAMEELLNIPLFDVRVSIYGNETLHDSFVKKKGSFRCSFETLKRLQKEKGIGTAVFIANKRNHSVIEEMSAIMKRENINFEVVATINPTSRGNSDPTNLRVSRDEYRRLLADKYIGFDGSLCTAGISRFRIAPSGDVNPCELMRHISFGNVYNSSWNHVISGSKRSNWTDYFCDLLENSSCNNCSVRKNCSFCPGLFYLKNGRLDSPDLYVCSISNIKKEIEELESQNWT
jgi:radical SAM protein with 4Fe4S-binding SPASM domain